MPKKELMVGNKAVAYGVKLARVEVASAYPITPQTTIVQYLAEFVANGDLDAKFIEVESEISAQISVQGASFAGARVFTATSGPGLHYMHHPMMGCMRPVVMAVVHRGVKSMQPDHTDLMSQRDTGWIQLYCEDNQEVLDTTIMAYKIAENPEVHLPVAIGLDGYILSYTAEPVEIPDQSEVDEFLPPFKPEYSLAEPLPYPEWVKAQGTRLYGSQDAWIKHQEIMMGSKKVISEVDQEFGERFGRSYGGLFEEYRCEDAEAVIIAMGTIASTARAAITELREQGMPVGLIKLKTFRPFPDAELREAAEKYKAIGVIDRNICLGGGGVVFTELRGAIYDVEPRPVVLGFHAGLAGKEVTPDHIKHIAKKTLEAAHGKVDGVVEWV
ncbi:pyruvate ferredoxin oxidoreductase [Candidatus Bathyarchaeota archaeon]|nr:pyruvate ferredoxin oxidoreductase [Candidatus Bathyarchaeota archaeon]